MSDSSTELQDEVPIGPRYYVCGLRHTHWASIGAVLHKTYDAALSEAKKVNERVQVLYALRRHAPHRAIVFAVYPAKKSMRFDGRWFLVNAVRAYAVTADDALAFSVEEVFAKGSS